VKRAAGICGWLGVVVLGAGCSTADKPAARAGMAPNGQQVRPAILSENQPGSANLGPTAVDPRWSSYGAYLQRIIDKVQDQWERIIIDQRAAPAPGRQVAVKFIMDAEGRIAKIVNVESTANEAEVRACVSAITDRAPYGPWTNEMRAALGEQQEMTFTFYYQ
jgi:hypothetical protein